MSNSRLMRRAIRLALATAVGSAAPLAFAQTATEAPASAKAAPALEEVVVTGSRLMQSPNEISISPITTVTSQDIAQTGMVRVEDILSNLPQVGAEQNSGTSISSVGVATVSLRYLGSQRTLVLIDGRRMQPGGAGGISGGNANAPDINQIPAGLIQRVDVLTGGASAVYGADAVAGVVNFVLDTHYQGVRIDGGYSFNNHQNNDQLYKNYLTDAGDPLPPSTVNTGQNRDFSILAGSNFADGKGNATAYVTYLNTSAAVGYQFDHAGCTLNGGSVPNSPIACGGSGTSAHGHFLVIGQQGGASTTIADLAIDPTTGKMRAYNDSDNYNYGALSYLQRPAERWTSGAFVNYEINEHATSTPRVMFARNTSTAQYGPSGSFYQLVNEGCPGTPTSTPANTNPLINAQEASVLCTPANIAANQAVYGGTGNQMTLYIARRSVESGGRQDSFTSDSFRQVAGVKGQINDVFSYDLYGQVGITQLSDIEGNFLGMPQITNALQVVTGPNGQPTCTSVINGTDPKCVPWNVWQPNGVTAAQLKYLEIPATWSSTSTEYITNGSVTGELGKYGVKLPTANSGLNFNVGTEYRSELFEFSPDYVFLNGLQAGGAPSLPINGGFHVWEGFVEARLPLIDDMPGAYRLSMDAGYRYSSYTLGFDTNTYKVGLEYAPIPSLRLRGGYNRAVRAPNIDELYAPPAIGAGGTADPCWGPTPILTQSECALTGVAPNRYGHLAVNSAAQINTQTAGNPNLTPEKADTYTVGFVLQPQSIPGLLWTVDAFDIRIENTITALSPTTIVLDCGLGIDPALCSRIHRTPSNESLWLATTGYVDVTQANIGTNTTKGVDTTAQYRWDLGRYGKLNTQLVGTYTKEFTLQPPPNGGSYDCSGLWGATCGAPIPKWRHVLGTTWSTPWSGFDLTLRWRYIDSVNVDRSSSNPQLSAPYYPSTSHIPAYNYIDMSAAMQLASNVDLRVGVNNIADKNPPLVLNGTLSDCPNTTCNDNTWVGTYDTLGRYIYAHIGMKF